MSEVPNKALTSECPLRCRLHGEPGIDLLRVMLRSFSLSKGFTSDLGKGIIVDAKRGMQKKQRLSARDVEHTLAIVRPSQQENLRSATENSIARRTEEYSIAAYNLSTRFSSSFLRVCPTANRGACRCTRTWPGPWIWRACFSGSRRRRKGDFPPARPQ